MGCLEMMTVAICSGGAFHKSMESRASGDQVLHSFQEQSEAHHKKEELRMQKEEQAKKNQLLRQVGLDNSHPAQSHCGADVSPSNPSSWEDTKDTLPAYLLIKLLNRTATENWCLKVSSIFLIKEGSIVDRHFQPLTRAE